MTVENSFSGSVAQGLPHGRVLLDGMALTFERLQATSKVAVSLPILRMIISAAVSSLPFEPEFYKSTYPDIREAHNAGRITDLRTHFIETGYFEGRLGADPNLDDQFYKTTYTDVVEAIATGKTPSAFDHYVRAGVFEGRYANPRDQEDAQQWIKLFQRGEAHQTTPRR